MERQRAKHAAKANSRNSGNRPETQNFRPLESRPSSLFPFCGFLPFFADFCGFLHNFFSQLSADEIQELPNELISENPQTIATTAFLRLISSHTPKKRTHFPYQPQTLEFGPWIFS